MPRQKFITYGFGGSDVPNNIDEEFEIEVDDDGNPIDLDDDGNPKKLNRKGKKVK